MHELLQAASEGVRAALLVVATVAAILSLFYGAIFLLGYAFAALFL